MSILQNLLYWLTAGLLVPCIAFLLFLLAKSVILSSREVLIVKRDSQSLDAFLCELDKTKGLKDIDSSITEKNRCHSLINEVLTGSQKQIVLHKIAEFEIAGEQHLARFSNMAKLGPITGLVGTLIPMGPALEGLANGDIQQLAGQMQIAFTTTVIGLIVGAISYLVFQHSKRQAFRELALLDRLIDTKWYLGNAN